MDKSVLKIIDASINRALEGIRVCEDVMRFSVQSGEHSKKLKDLRHSIVKAAEKYPVHGLLDARDTKSDPIKFNDNECYQDICSAKIYN